MRHAHRLLAAVAASLTLTLAAPAGATETEEPAPFLYAKDKAGDWYDAGGGTKADVAASSGLDVLRVRHTVRDGNLIVVSRHKDLTVENTNTSPDEVPVGGGMTMFSAYVEPKFGDKNGYSFSINRQGLIDIQDYDDALVPCEGAWTRIRLDVDRVRYVVPVTCLPTVSVTRTLAQAIYYKIVKRRADGVEVVELVAIDQNDQRPPALTLR